MSDKNEVWAVEVQTTNGGEWRFTTVCGSKHEAELSANALRPLAWPVRHRRFLVAEEWEYTRELWQVEVYDTEETGGFAGWRMVGRAHDCEVEAGEYMHRLQTALPLRRFRVVRYVPESEAT